jgi:hypothetical protein
VSDLRDRILAALLARHEAHPDSYTYVSSILGDLGTAYDMEVGEVFTGLQREGLIEVLSTTNIRIRLTDKGRTAARSS